VRVLRPALWGGTVRTSSDLQDVKLEAQTSVLSFGDFSLHGQRKVTRSPVRRVEGSAQKQTNQSTNRVNS